jgi:hypothetical protein
VLKLIWDPAPPGQPDDPAYQNSLDRLLQLPDGGQPPIPLAELKKGLSDAELQQLILPGNLQAAVSNWAGAGPREVVVMVHGFLFDVALNHPDPTDDPFNGVYGPPSSSNNESWLTIVNDSDAIAFSWFSGGTLEECWFDAGDACWSSPYSYAICDLAPLAAHSLALVIEAAAATGATVDVLAHSLGTRTTIKALALLAARGKPAAVRRAVLMGGAEYSIDANAVATTADVTTQFFNLVNSDDEVLTLLGNKYGDPTRTPGGASARVIGAGGVAALGNWEDIQIDDMPTVATVQQQLKLTLSGLPTGGRGNHWAYYMHPDNQTFMHALLYDRTLDIARLRALGLPGLVRADSYGTALGTPIPAIPQTCRARQRLWGGVG